MFAVNECNAAAKKTKQKQNTNMGDSRGKILIVVKSQLDLPKGTEICFFLQLGECKLTSKG